MKVEILELKLSSDGFVAEQGDRFTVPDEVGASWCAAGWAKDLSGTTATGERLVVKSVVVPHDVNSTVIGGVV